MRRISLIAICIIAISLSSISVDAAAKPGKTTITNTQAKSENSISISWKKVKNVSGYQVYMNGKAVKSLTALSFTSTGLKADTAYSFKVRAYKKAKKTQWYNKKTKKWQNKKPAKKNRGKSRKKAVTTYGPFSAVKSIKTLPHVHSFGTWHTALKADCEEDGMQKRSCNCGKAETRSIPKTGHSWGTWKTVKEATCKTAGEEIRYCNNNKAHTEKRQIPKAEHLWGTEKVLVVEPTCSKEGKKATVCLSCGDTKDEEVVPKTEHIWEHKIKAKATCDEPGLEADICKVCKEEKNETQIPKTGHLWGEETIDTPATCKQTGEKSVHCLLCEERKDITEIPKADHEFYDWVILKNASCAQEGTKMRTCKVCMFKEVESIDMTKHEWDDEFTIDKTPTCTEDGSRSIHCKSCDAVKNSEMILSKGHSWDEDYTVDSPADCTHDGSMSIHCKNCDEVTDARLIPATEHSWDEGIIKREPTCQLLGSRQKTCNLCGSKKTEAIPKLDHEWERVVNREPTCLLAGQARLTCKLCGDARNETLSKLDHEYSDEYTVIEEATCASEGKKGRYCTLCNRVYTDEQAVPKLSHTPSEWVVVREPSACEVNDGLKKKTCTSCGSPIISINFSRNHDWEEDYTVDTEPTCDLWGSESIHCKLCDRTKDRQGIEPLGHDTSGEWFVTKEATQTSEGMEKTRCLTCDKLMPGRTIPKIITEDEQAFADNIDGKEYTIYCIGIELPEFRDLISLPEGYAHYIDLNLPGWEIMQTLPSGKTTQVAYEDEPLDQIRSVYAEDVDGNPVDTYYTWPSMKVEANKDYTYTATKNGQEISFVVHRRDYAWEVFDNTINSFIDENINDAMSEYTKLETAANYVASYDYSPIGKDCHWPQSVPISGHGVCDAKENILEDILNIVGIENHCHHSTVNGEPHANNAVRLSNGSMYMVDATWGEVSIKALDSNGLRVNTERIPQSLTYEWFEGIPDTVTFPDNITEIRADAVNGLFYSAWHYMKNGPRKIVIPASVTNIVDGALSGGNTIEEVIVDKDNPVYETREDGCLYNKVDGSLVFRPPAIK